METFSALLALCVGIHRSPVNSPHKGQWRGALMFSLICVWRNRFSKQSWCWSFETLSRPLWRHSSEINLHTWTLMSPDISRIYSFIDNSYVKIFYCTFHEIYALGWPLSVYCDQYHPDHCGLTVIKSSATRLFVQHFVFLMLHAPS